MKQYIRLIVILHIKLKLLLFLYFFFIICRSKEMLEIKIRKIGNLKEYIFILLRENQRFIDEN